METLRKFFAPRLEHCKKNGSFAVLYALLAEGLLYGYLGFIMLFSLETLLPTFISVRLSLTLFFFVLISLSFVLALLGRFLEIDFKWSERENHLLIRIGILWGIGILALSLYKFPPILIPAILLAFFFIGYLFFKEFLDKKH